MYHAAEATPGNGSYRSVSSTSRRLPAPQQRTSRRAVRLLIQCCVLERHIQDAFRGLMQLLDGVTPAMLRALGIAALRSWRQKPRTGYQRDAVERPSLDVFSLNEFGIELIPLLAEHKSVANPHNPAMLLAFVNDQAMNTAWMGSVLEFLWWLERAGLAVPTAFGKKEHHEDRDYEHQHRWYPTTMRLTARGARLIDGSDNHPMLPGFLDRIRERCPGLSEGVIALLVDARACCDHSLMRPAVVLMGVAYELAIEQIVDALVTKGFVLPNTADQKPAERIQRIRTLLSSDRAKGILPDSDARKVARMAYDFAEDLRQRRNEAAHTSPTFDFDHTEETEEYLVSAGRHLPALWSLAM